MKNVLLLIHDDVGQEARLQAALDVVRALEGHLTCVDVSVPPELVVDGFGSVDGYAMLLDEEHKREAINGARLERRLSVEGVPWSWVDATGQIARCLTETANLADLIVVNLALESFPLPDMRAIAGDLIVRARKPILAVPERCHRLNFNSAVIAWDGSSHAAAALRAAIPLLQRTREVTLIEIDDHSVMSPAEEAASYLSRHDIHAIICRIATGGQPAGDVLLSEVVRRAPGYVVMGGFGHLRFAEALFGGVTRAMLGKSPVPVVFAH